MLLAIDLGNTNTVLGVFDGERLVADFRLRTEGHATGDELGLVVTGLLARNDISAANVHGLVVSSVMPSLARSVDELAERYFHVTPLVVGPGVRSGIRILTDDGGTGSMRLSLAACSTSASRLMSNPGAMAPPR